jgi:RecA/RadA recombinase
MASIMDKLKKNSRLKYTNVLSKSEIFNKKDVILTEVPMINVALSGSLDAGLTSGLTVLAGPSKHFKTSFALLMASAYMKKYDDATLIFYDSEFGSPQSYFETYGIDPDKVLHTPIMDVEELKFDLINQLELIERGDKVIIIIDSIGNLSSRKEKDDAINEKSVADMTRARALKSLFRMATPYLTMKNVPLLAINHTYQTMEMFSKAVVSGGTGIYYSSDNIWIIGRRQGEKDGTSILGYEFVVNIEKSRFVKEKSKIMIGVSWEGGINKFSGLLENAVDGEFVHKGKKGRSTGYFHMNHETGEVEEKAHYERETMNAEFWKDILLNPAFNQYLKKKYQISIVGLQDKVEEEISDMEEIELDD